MHNSFLANQDLGEERLYFYPCQVVTHVLFHCTLEGIVLEVLIPRNSSRAARFPLFTDLFFEELMTWEQSGH